MKNTPEYWQQAVTELSAKDKKLAKLITQFPHPLELSSDAFLTLVRTVVGQQISVKAAASVFGKLNDSLKPSIQPTNLLKSTTEELRAVGLSRQKAGYLHNLAEFFIAEKANSAYWKQQDYPSTQQKLLQINGIGNWSVQMFAIFYLGEPDIFPIKDLGLVRAIQNIYSPNQKLGPKDLQKIADSWKPWCTAATWFLWRSIDSDLTTY